MYRPETVARQIAFLDRFLKGVDNDVAAWPRVELEVRERANVGQFRVEQEWPLARTEFRPLYLDARAGTMAWEPVTEVSELSYDATATDIDAVFDHAFAQDTEITGHTKLRLWVSAPQHTTSVANGRRGRLRLHPAVSAASFAELTGYLGAAASSWGGCDDEAVCK